VIEDAPLKELERLLAMVDILEPLSPKELEHVALLSSSIRLDPGEAVTLDDDRGTLHLLVSGRVRVHEPRPGGQDLTISMVEDGTVVGQTGFAVRLSLTLRVEALQPSTLLVIRWEDFEGLILRNPKVGVKAIRLLSERLAVCEGRLSELIRKQVPERLAGLILDLGEHQGVVTRDGSRRIPTRYTHHQLASMIGSNREAVTRAFRKLKEAGAVEVEGRRICVTDAHTLKRLANAEP
jgi:CRP/FNR family transcriptional regulator, cyclic AMP receptor protein